MTNLFDRCDLLKWALSAASLSVAHAFPDAPPIRIAVSGPGERGLELRRLRFSCLLGLSCLLPAAGQDMVKVLPVEIEAVLVTPGAGIQTFQRFRGQTPYPGPRWSEAGPVEKVADAASKPDFPESSVAYLRWFWHQIEPEPGKYRWEIIDLALEEVRRHGQTLDIRLGPYDPHDPLPEWFRLSGARRANKPTDNDGQIWSPDSSDPLYIKHWSALVRAAGARYDGHPYLNSVDISTVGYWGEGWGPYMPDWATQKTLIDVYFEAFRRTPLLMNFDELPALKYGVERGAGWRLDCWGDLDGQVAKNFIHMFDRYPQQVVRAGIQDAWQRSPVSLETCGTPASWKRSGYSDRQLQYIFDQALRWHASTINIKSTQVPPEWKEAFEEFQKKLGYRFILRKIEYPRAVRAGQMAPIHMWWLNAGAAPIYADYTLAVQLTSPAGEAVIRTSADVKKWLPGDAVYDASIYIADNLKPGEYRFRVALLDPRTGAPAIPLAIAGRQPDGWYDVGSLHVE